MKEYSSQKLDEIRTVDLHIVTMVCDACGLTDRRVLGHSQEQTADWWSIERPGLNAQLCYCSVLCLQKGVLTIVETVGGLEYTAQVDGKFNRVISQRFA